MEETNVKTAKQTWVLPTYISIVTILGVLLSVQPVLTYCADFLRESDKVYEALQIVVLSIIMFLCRSLPIPTRKGEGFDISSVAIFASFLSKGLGATIIILLVSAFFTYDRQEDGKIKHIFNTSILKTLFNNFYLVISAVIGAYVFELSGGPRYDPAQPFGHIQLPSVLLPSLLYLVVSLLSDGLFMAMLIMILKGAPFFRTLTGGLRTMAPTLLALSPIGYFIAFIFTTRDSGPYLALLFFVPLMFARYAFKLYLDSKEQFLRTISTLTAAIEAKDKYTEGHSKRVAEYSVALAQEMKLRNARIENIKVAAVLHDIGKIGIDDEILRKPTKLNEDEWSKIVQHPSIGIKILEDVDMPQAIKEMIHYHHIRFDRTGYPETGREKALPIEVHIVSLADAYDAMTSDRPYRSAMSEDMAVDIIEQENGTQFHPEVVEAFLRLKKRK